MKQVLLSALLLGSSVVAQAEHFQKLRLTLAGGEKVDMPTKHLCITFREGNMICTEGDQSKTFALNQVKSLSFALPTALQTVQSTLNAQDAANALHTAPLGSLMHLYNLNGVLVKQWVKTNHESTVESLNVPSGLYLLQTQGKTLKITVR